ncbi:DUF4124 domain-containing protein [Zestomonas thermotolerans]|jgi:hypothetical protein|uniref:DUF4124 domain-containing protein n=1 Tax=Zestomonas thermotolerans TaxID=157784 RepID=UPI000485E7CF|nr:DUF4124 domain-containing protein [Pseudomonas thermotolerans]MBO2511334.1 DUF4124 domain-containing protein [Gammaproteobacteria bacterium]
MLKPASLCVTLLGTLLPLAGQAAELYRYVNDKGVVVLDRQGVPPQYVAKGYEVLNEQGRVIRVIPPAPSPEEMQRRLAEKARERSDAQLLRLYSSAEDVERAKARKLAEIDGLISVASGNLQSLRTQQANLQSQAADHERAGREVPAHLVAQIENLKAEQAHTLRDIERYRKARADAEVSFDADRQRLLELLGNR